MDPVHSFLQSLGEAQGDTRAQAAIAAEFLVMTRPKHEHEMIRAAVDAAAVLHWFSAEHLAKVLDVSAADAQLRFSILRSFPFVEPYRRGQSEFYNVHESTRLGWRKKIALVASEWFRALSVRASAYFADDATPAGRIEWIYHLLCGDPNVGASELERLDRKWAISKTSTPWLWPFESLLTRVSSMTGHAPGACSLWDGSATTEAKARNCWNFPRTF
jgi:hypothetical protein